MLSNTLEENSRVGGKLTSNAMFVWKNTTTVLIVDERTTTCRPCVSVICTWSTDVYAFMDNLKEQQFGECTYHV